MPALPAWIPVRADSARRRAPQAASGSGRGSPLRPAPGEGEPAALAAAGSGEPLAVRARPQDAHVADARAWLAALPPLQPGRQASPPGGKLPPLPGEQAPREGEAAAGPEVRAADNRLSA